MFFGEAYDFTPRNYRRIPSSLMHHIIQTIQDNLDLSMVPGGRLKLLPYRIEQNKPFCYSCIGFEYHPLAVAKTRHFYAYLDARDQKTPGRLFIQPHDHIISFEFWSADLWMEFGVFLAALQEALHKGLDPHEPEKLINVECKMNNLSRDRIKHTQWQVLPRYRNPITLVDPETKVLLTFEDSSYGKPYNFEEDKYRAISYPLMIDIIRKIQEHLDIDRLPEGKLKKLDAL